MLLPRPRLAQELLATACGTSFHGNALRQAKKLPELSEDDRQVLDRWLIGSQIGQDWFELQAIANKITAAATLEE